MLIPLKLVRDRPLQQQLFDQLRELIASARLQPGSRMPSSRMLAEQFAISRITVLLTYERLVAEGYLETLPANGTFVARRPLRAPLPSTNPPLPSCAPVRLTQSPANRIGRPDPALFPAGRWRALMRSALDRLGGQLAAGAPGEHPALRAAIGSWLSASRGLVVNADQIVLVNGRQQALHLAAHLLLRPGSRAVVEDPCDTQTAAAFSSAGATLECVEVDQDGLRTDGLPGGEIALAYVTPEHQRPLGVTLAVQRRSALLQWAEHTGAVILEEDCEGELRYHGLDALPLMGLDQSDRVILIGGFDTSLGPWLSRGYMVVPPRLVGAAFAARRLIDDSPHWLEETALAELVASGAYARHVHRLSKEYSARRDALLAALRQQFGGETQTWGADAGLHLTWLPPSDLGSVRALAEMATRCELEALPQRARERDVVLLGFGSLPERGIGPRIARFATLVQANCLGAALSAD